ncbi:MAG: ShlB/FhaC/HecB family hemolysin secretion/activation protein [Burkholderiaceae bacterium]
MPSRLRRLALCLAIGCTGAIAQAQTSPSTEVAGPTLDIQRYAIDGDVPMTDPQVQALLAPFVGPGKTMGDIEGAARALEVSLRSQGYAFHRVFVPEQKPVDGVVKLGVIQIRVGKVEVTGNNFFSSENIRRSLGSLKEGEIPEVRTLGRDVTASNANPAKQVTVTFKESSEPNQVDAEIKVKDSDPVNYFASMSLNEKVTGSGPALHTRRISGGFQHSNLFDRDQVMTVSYTTDPGYPNNVSLIGAYYQVPIYGTGMNLSASFVSSDVNSGQVRQGSNVFDVSGSGQFAGVRLSKALNRVDTWQQTVAVGLDDRYFKNSTTFNGAQIQPNVGSRVLSLQYTFRNEPNWGVLAGSVDYLFNIGGGRSNSAANHAANGGTKNWDAVRYSLEAATLVGNWQLSGRFKGQLSGDSLIAGEQFGLGGANSVRGFSDRVVSGDRGFQWNIEGMGPGIGELKVRPIVFVDGGRVWVRGGSDESLMSVGVGIRLNYEKVQLGVDLAKAMDSPRAAPSGNPIRLHVAASYRF